MTSGADVALFPASGAASDGGRVFISTGLDDKSCWALSDRATCAACCGLLCAAVEGWFAPAEAMTANVSSTRDVSGDSDCEEVCGWFARGSPTGALSGFGGANAAYKCEGMGW